MKKQEEQFEPGYFCYFDRNAFSRRRFFTRKPISSVPPEFQEAAKKRRAEIARQTFCNDKAAKEKVMKRDLASFVVSCMDNVEKAEQAIRN